MCRVADLSWFPHNPAKWRQRTAGLSPLAKAAYAELRDAAWEATTREMPACTLPNDDKQLAAMSGLGALWKRVRSEVRPLFTITDVGLCDATLLTIWEKQHGLYEARKEAGARGGKAKANSQQNPSNATAKAKQNPTNKEREEPLPLQGKKAPATDGAPALESARTSVAADEEHREAKSRNGIRNGEPRAVLAAPVSLKEMMAKLAPGLIP